MGFYDYSVTTANGEEFSMENYKGKVVLVVPPNPEAVIIVDITP